MKLLASRMVYMLIHLQHTIKSAKHFSVILFFVTIISVFFKVMLTEKLLLIQLQNPLITRGMVIFL